MLQAMSASATLGGLYILLFIALVVGAFVWVSRNIFAPMARRARDKEIETAMRLGKADAEAQDRIARKIMDERDQ